MIGRTVAELTVFNMAVVRHIAFLPRDALLARYMLSSCVCLSVCPSQAGSVPKWLNTKSRKQRCTIGSSFSNAKDLDEIQTELPQGGRQIVVNVNVSVVNIAFLWFFCGFRSVAVNSVYKLQFFIVIFTVLLPVLSRLLIMFINTFSIFQDGGRPPSWIS